MTAFDAVVVGGGVAGLSAALALSAEQRVLLLEREPLLAAHASGRNAAIFRPLERDATTAVLAGRSAERFGELDVGPLLRRTGLLLAARSSAELAELRDHAAAQAVECELVEGAALYERSPLLVGGEVGAALWVPAGGVIDIHALTSALAARARDAGARLHIGSAVARVNVERGRATGVALEDGTVLHASTVVLAAGAWGAMLGASAGAALPLVPWRRHLVQLGAVAGCEPQEPVVWRVDDELYFRPESGGVLCSPCDAEPSAPGVPLADATALELLARKLARSAPKLASAGVRSSWACLRTFAPDGELVLGGDPRVDGLHWFAGLGGRGLGVAVAAGELLAELVRGRPSASDLELAAAVAPARLL